jgi:hypothetical protein
VTIKTTRATAQTCRNAYLIVETLVGLVILVDFEVNFIGRYGQCAVDRANRTDKFTLGRVMYWPGKFLFHVFIVDLHHVVCIGVIQLVLIIGFD